jgi:hypothetical protein
MMWYNIFFLKNMFLNKAWKICVFGKLDNFCVCKFWEILPDFFTKTCFRCLQGGSKALALSWSKKIKKCKLWSDYSANQKSLNSLYSPLSLSVLAHGHTNVDASVHENMNACRPSLSPFLSLSHARTRARARTHTHTGCGTGPHYQTQAEKNAVITLHKLSERERERERESVCVRVCVCVCVCRPEPCWWAVVSVFGYGRLQLCFSTFNLGSEL